MPRPRRVVQCRRAGRNHPDGPTTAGEGGMTNHLPHRGSVYHCPPQSLVRVSLRHPHPRGHTRAGSCRGPDDAVKGESDRALGGYSPPSPRARGEQPAHARAPIRHPPPTPIREHEGHPPRHGAAGTPDRSDEGRNSRRASRVFRAPRPTLRRFIQTSGWRTPGTHSIREADLGMTLRHHGRAWRSGPHSGMK